jgi:hypothetical protein
LTKKESGRKFAPIKEGMRVSYTLKTTKDDLEPISVTGILEKISTDELIIKGITVSINDLSKFGRKKSVTSFSGGLLLTLGNTLWLGTLLAPEPKPPYECYNCTTFVIESPGAKMGPVIVVATGLGLSAWGVNTLVKNAQKDVISVWKLEVINE